MAGDIPDVKLIMVGDYFVGKTCLGIRRLYGRFKHGWVPTKLEEYTEDIIVDDKPIRWSLWDTAGGVLRQYFSSIICASYVSHMLWVVVTAAVVLVSVSNK